MSLISVIVPVYNVETYLKRCIKSIQNQTIKDIEIILVDDGSTDGSGKLCDDLKEEDNRIKVIHQKNKGLAGARNTGLKYVTGEYIGFIDSDDWISKDYYEKLYNLSVKYNAGIVSCSFIRVNNENDIKGSKKPHIILERNDALTWYLKSAIKSGNNDVSCCTKLYKKEILADLEFQEGIIYEDVIFNWFAINKCNTYIKSFETNYYYYVNNNSITASQFSNKNFDLLDGAELIRNSYEGNNEIIKELLDIYVAKTHFSILIKILKSKIIEKQMLQKELDIVKQNYKLLMGSSLSVFRKIVLVVIVIFPEKLWFYIKR